MSSVLEVEHKTTEPARTSNDASALVDRAHLARYTMGDAELEKEILQLFFTHSAVQLGQLLEAVGNPALWRDATHGLKGSARGIGAWALGDAAEAAERDKDEGSGTHERHVTRLREHIASTNAAITTIVG